MKALMTQMLELSSRGFTVTMINIFKKVEGEHGASSQKTWNF